MRDATQLGFWSSLVTLPAVFANSIPSALQSTSPFPMELCHGVDIEDASIPTLSSHFESGKLTSQQLTRCYLDRISLVNEYLHAILEINPDAISISRVLDQERADNKTRGPLHGIPFVSKDNFYTNDRHNTSEGGLVLLGGRYPRESTVITRARQAGMVLLGHAALSEAADHRALSNFSDGYSTRGGQTRNPYNLTQATSGSSGGSAVSVAANLAAVAFGTETHGSLVHPAAQLGVVAIKPTPGLVSRSGVIPGSFLHDTPGPFAHDVFSAALLLDAIYGVDLYDNLTWTQTGRTPVDGYAAYVRTDIKGLRIGVPWNPYWNTTSVINSPGNRELFQGSLEQLRDAGAEIYNVTIAGITDFVNIYGFGQNNDVYGTDATHDGLIAFYTLLAVGYKEWLKDWKFPDGDDRQNFTSLSDMAAWNRANSNVTGASGGTVWWYNTVSGQDFYDSAVASDGVLNDTFWTAMDYTRRSARSIIDRGFAYFTDNGTFIELDTLIIPSQNAGGGDNPCASVPAYAGYPAMSVPIGQNAWDVPAAFCLWGREYQEAKLVNAAAAIEAVLKWKAKPLYHNYDIASGPWDTPWPGYSCTDASLDVMACDAI